MEILLDYHFPNSNYNLNDNLEDFMNCPPQALSFDNLTITIEELKNIILSFDVNKSPGPDQIDFRIIRRIFESSPSFLLEWINKCFQLCHFPSILKQAEVMFFIKPNKNSDEPSSYRPICLLPCLGKLIEKTLVQRLTYHLELNKKLSDKQHGFRELFSCETALYSTISQINHNIKNNRYTTLISTDIKGAFDSIIWKKLIESLINLESPFNLIKLVISYLSKRKVQVTLENNIISKPIFKGFPQGSCLGPLMWNVIANQFLFNFYLPHSEIVAYADDFMFIISGESKKELEENCNFAMNQFSNFCYEQRLTISTDKCLQLTLSKPYNLLLKPTVKLHERSIRKVDNFKYLGIYIDEKLNWNAHIEYLKRKVMKIHKNSMKFTSTMWGIPSSYLKTWYITVIEKIVSYASAIWANNLTKTQKNVLDSIQRPFTLKISKGFKTTSTHALQILSGIAPLSIQVQKEATLTKLLRLNISCSFANVFFNSKDYTKKIKSCLVHPSFTQHIEQIFLPPKFSPYNDNTIYTDGSKTDQGVGCAFVAYRNNNKVTSHKFTLNKNNSVYQSELLAILKAVQWSVENKFIPVTIFSDSKSALQGIQIFKQKNNLIKRIQSLLLENPTIYLSWIKAHTGHFGNEHADELAKKATQEIENIKLSLPTTFLKSSLKKLTLQQWTLIWSNSSKGRHTFEFFPIPSYNLNSHATYLTQIFTAHGHFPTYLHRFKILHTPSCLCGNSGTPDHYLFECNNTKQYHLKKPSIANKNKWALSVLNSRPSQKKIKYIIDITQEICNRLSRQSNSPCSNNVDV